MITLFFKLLCGHALGDFALQSDTMAQRKNRNRAIDPRSIPPGAKPQAVWFYFLTSHALIHGGIVYLITGSVLLGVIETLFHWGIDFWKCENLYGIHADQTLHILCKVLYVVMMHSRG